MDLESLQKRAGIIRQIRSFFDTKNYLELDTPLLSSDLIPESCLEVFETKRLFPQGSKKKEQSLYLIPSPEIWMKKIIARNKTNIYQICKCFRNGESSGHLHSCEFTMLEYYTMNADYLDSITLTEKLFEYLLIQNSINTENFLPFERITVQEAFTKWAGFDLFIAAEKKGELEKNAQRLGLSPMKDLSTPALYDLIFIHTVEPNLKTQKPVFLFDYPSFVPCLAKLSNDKKTYERWELYWNGIELANCFSEQTNPQKVKEFFINEESEKKKNAIIHHKINRDYWKFFENFPKCSGVAMGVDRLIMALTERKTINTVLPFEVNG